MRFPKCDVPQPGGGWPLDPVDPSHVCHRKPLAGTTLLLTCCLILGCPGGQPREGTAPDQKDDVLVERQSNPPQIRYTVRKGDCTISWLASVSEINRGVVQHRPDCALPLAEQAPWIALLLHKFLDAKPEAEPLRTLSWGRLYPDAARDATVAVRLALAARRSPDWDARRGAPRGGDVNGFVRQLANDALIFEEMRRVFDDAGLEIRVASVEKVLVLPVRAIPFGDRLLAGGALPQDKLPFDCQAWLSVTRQKERVQPKGREE